MAAGGIGIRLGPVSAHAAPLKIQYAKEVTTICPYCAVGCSIIVSVRNGKVVNTEGDPDSPINRGALCSKGGSIYQMAVNKNRLDKPLYRAPYSAEWKEVEWEWALEKIARNVKTSRDKSFRFKNSKGETVNRTEGIASVGSAALDNEECFVYQKFLRSLGLVYIEHQARLCHSSTVPALAESFGRGAMTNHWIDIKNSDVILIMGSNPASNHPVAFKWITAAMERGAKLICVDPRFTQSAAKAHLYAPLRSGTDIAFLGGMIKYILDNKLYFEQYVRQYTNAAFLVNPAFKLPGDNQGVFSGLTDGRYDKGTWTYQTDGSGAIRKDPALRDPHCVFQLLKKHYSRYTLERVSKITGTPADKLTEVYKLYASTGTPDRSGTELYAMGWTQHTVGVQNIRTMCIIQLLLGNMGIPGGGVAAMRGESNVQGSTDYGLLFHIWPGYLNTPKASLQTLTNYNGKETPTTREPNSLNWWKNKPKYVASFLKSMYGTNATLEEAYAMMPKIDDGANHSWLMLFDQMYKGKFTGFFAWGMNPACSGANSTKVRKALGKLDWMVNVNLYDNETGSFWRGPGMDPAKIKTEVFMLPCAASCEKEGSITNSGRWMQWRYKAVDAPGVGLPDGDICSELFFKIRALYEQHGGPLKEAITKLTWPYGPRTADGHFHFDPHAVAREINGFFLADKKVENPAKKGDFREFRKGDPVPSFAWLQDDGTTSSGCWVYCGSYADRGNLAARRGVKDPTGLGLYPEWSWAWPLNRRILYNGASVDPTGKPWTAGKAVIQWDGGKWIGDIPDGAGDPGAGRPPFIMKPDGVASLFGPGLADGPFPEHYEPLECPVEKNLMSVQKHNPTIRRFDQLGVGSDLDVYSNVGGCDPRYPFICSTYRISEHWQTGLQTRWCPWLAEMQPEMWCEMSRELARERKIENGDRVIVSSPRGQVECVAIVTARFKPFTIDGTIIHEVGIPWHFGWITTADRPYRPGDKKAEVFTRGDAANHVTPTIGDANTMIPESKAFMVNVVKKGVQ